MTDAKHEKDAAPGGTDPKLEAEAADATAATGEEKAAKGKPAPAKAEGAKKPAKAKAKAKPKPKAKAKPKAEEPDAADQPEKAEDAKPVKPKPRRRGAEAAAGRSARPARKRAAGGGAGEQVTVKATARYVRTAPRKARLVIDHIRGKGVDEARAILLHTPRGASKDVLKLLNSAIANAENNHELVADELTVAQAFVDEGPTLKRFRPRAQGRATRIRKRTSHMTITLTSKDG